MGGVSCPKPTYKKPKPEKVQKIQLQDAEECWVCGCTNDLDPHHCFQGNGRRAKSEKYGLIVHLCNRHHTQAIAGDRGIHHNAELRDRLQRYAQGEFEKVYSRELFTQEFSKNYLD